ncbi:hypothetical protein NNG64_04455 [Bacillus siamensis]|uniref:Uncharacterized protein n=1 Tax=Bacillus siamensis TaxID=659243 RepID=A0AAI8N1F3_9BACI|nr:MULTISPECIES: hypothetical protein [Bacillus]AME05999.1 hypothetical protein AUL54_06430 [Bacillus sp. SDLI1]AUJ78493.1 hypothetical protein CWD84_17620 [Bacillus siamensis]UUA85072.1 hypothetical protein NNG64_04455 [Bacillus siamensis]
MKTISQAFEELGKNLRCAAERMPKPKPLSTEAFIMLSKGDRAWKQFMRTHLRRHGLFRSRSSVYRV